MLAVILKLKVVCNLCSLIQDDDVMEITHEMLRHKKTDLHAKHLCRFGAYIRCRAWYIIISKLVRSLRSMKT